jgi:tRNA A37 threonylcarbamoyladenosine synthetase subunit TsaC/SUA5/YrdC
MKDSLTRAESAVAVAERVSMPLMVPKASSSGRTTSRSTSAGEDDWYGAVTVMFDEENAGKNSRGSRPSDNQPRTRVPSTTIPMVTG